MGFDALLSMVMEPLQQPLFDPPPRARRTPPSPPSLASLLAGEGARKTPARAIPAKTAVVPHPAAAKAVPNTAQKNPPKAPPRRPGEAREGRHANGRGDDASKLADSAGAWLPDLTLPDEQARGEGESDESSDQEEDADQRSAGGASDGYDAELVMDLLPTQGNSGIFEVVFPNGESMGVMVDIGASTAAFILSPQSAAMRDLLNSKQMELEGGLRRRMDKLVRLTVL